MQCVKNEILVQCRSDSLLFAICLNGTLVDGKNYIKERKAVAVIGRLVCRMKFE